MDESNLSEDQKPKEEPYFEYVTMPKGEEMVQKLKEAKILGTSPKIDKFYHFFINFIENRSVSDGDLNMVWIMAANETLNDYPLSVRAAVEITFDKVINAIIPNQKFADRAKELRKKIMEYFQKQGK